MRKGTATYVRIFVKSSDVTRLLSRSIVDGVDSKGHGTSTTQAYRLLKGVKVTDCTVSLSRQSRMDLHDDSKTMSGARMTRELNVTVHDVNSSA